MQSQLFDSLTGLLQHQTIDAQRWMNKLIADFPKEKWFLAPEVIETNMAWQVSHLILSQYYYTIVLIAGPKNELAQRIPVKEYSALFAKGERRNEVIKEVSVEELVHHLKLVQEKTTAIISGLNHEDLLTDVFFIKPHPFVKTRQDAISWNIKHTMWHCGQIATLKRVIDGPFEYGM